MPSGIFWRGIVVSKKWDTPKIYKKGRKSMIDYIVKRNGEPQLFDPVRIYRAIEKAFNAIEVNNLLLFINISKQINL